MHVVNEANETSFEAASLLGHIIRCNVFFLLSYFILILIIKIGMEFVGEIIAELVGLNRSTYQWVIDTVDEDERRRRRRAEIDENRREMAADVKELRDAKKAAQAEGGDSSDSDDE
jgi:hypothetical protein